MLPLGFERLDIAGLSLALSNESCVLRLRLVEVSLCFNSHDSNLLVSIDNKLLSISLSIIDFSNSIGLDLVDHDLLHTFSLGDEDRCIFLCLRLGDLFVGVGFELLLLLVNLCSRDLLLQLIKLSLVDSL